MPNLSLVALAGLAGLVAGSFLATLVVRWPRGEGLGGRSHCDQCGHQLAAADLVPLLSFLWQRGRCRHCRQPIDRRHPLLEGAAALLAMLALAASPGPAGLAGALFGWILLALLALDSAHFWLPDRLTLPLLALGLALGRGNLTERLMGAAAAGGLLLLLAAGYRRLRRHDGLGLGDVKLGAALGAWLGPLLIGPLFILSALLGLLLAWRAPRRATGARIARIPFGACLAVAAFPLWLAGAASAGSVPC